MNTITKEEEDLENVQISKEDIEDSQNKLYQLKEIIDEKNFLGCSKEEMKEIIELKNQLKALIFYSSTYRS